MNYTQLITEVQKVALKQHNVNSFSSNDVYDEWNKPHTQYASVNIGLESADRTENTIIYNCVLYYGDRLLQNASNKIAIQDDAVKVLQGIISNLPDEITYYTPINYTIFEQEFADYIAGAYCRVRLETEFDQGNCSLDDYIEELKTLYVTENGIFNVAGYDQVEVHVEGGTVEGITEEECREIVEGYNYATKDEIPDLTPYAKTVDVNTGLASKQPIGDYALRSELPDLAPYATKDEIPSLDGYATEQWVNDQGFLTEHQDLSEYAKIVDVNTGLESKQDKGDYALRSELPDLTNYATKDEIPSLNGYATEQWVENKGYLTEHQPLKTINNESIVGTGNITIDGGKPILVVEYQKKFTEEDVALFNSMTDQERTIYVKYKEANVIFDAINSGVRAGTGMVFLSTVYGNTKLVAWDGDPRVNTTPVVYNLRTLITSTNFDFDETTSTLNININYY